MFPILYSPNLTSVQDYRKSHSFDTTDFCQPSDVVVEELVPEMAEGEHSNWGTITFMLGFALMMILDVALG